MSQEIINIGALPNDGEGDPLRTAFQKINNNFTQVFQAGYFTTEGYTFDDTADQVIFETPTGLFTQASFQINSSNPDNDDSQNITINPAISNDGSNVKFTAFGTMFYNDYVVSSYDMDVFEGNVRLMVSPSVDTPINHFISARVNFSDVVLGSPMSTEGGNTLITENSFTLTTETPA